MHKTVANLIDIKKKIYLKNPDLKFEPEIIAVSKTFSLETIFPLIDFGHLDFGENKVQEALEKWSDLKKEKINLKLHMIGKLQTNKVKQAVKLFDYIHSLDSIKLAKKIAEEQKKIQRNLKIFIQINIGNENQKNGIALDKVADFYKICVQEYNLNIIGLMCLPPNDIDSEIFFEKMYKISKDLGLSQLSMGMSSDFLKAIKYNATFLRLGSIIFGQRN
tara:strand:- start:2177 stop:2833 length:657 start_codon:yes stop_codon:yes gene_type:complete